jgi:hypothetical protein
LWTPWQLAFRHPATTGNSLSIHIPTRIKDNEKLYTIETNFVKQYKIKQMINFFDHFLKISVFWNKLPPQLFFSLLHLLDAAVNCFLYIREVKRVRTFFPRHQVNDDSQEQWFSTGGVLLIALGVAHFLYLFLWRI